jgi:hypothetical protein
LAIIDFIGFEIVREGGFSLLVDGTTFDGCFRRETFVTVVIVRFGNCEIVLLLFFVRLLFVVDGVFATFEETG